MAATAFQDGKDGSPTVRAYRKIESHQERASKSFEIGVAMASPHSFLCLMVANAA
jgi:hypothetical protein